MKNVSWTIMALTMVAYLLLNYAWLAAGNAPAVADGLRGPLKTICLVVAGFVYLATAVLIALGDHDQWVGATAATAGGGVVAGLVLIIASSALFRPGQFFHDGTVVERLPTLLLVVVGAGTAAGLLAVVVGAAARAAFRSR